MNRKKHFHPHWWERVLLLIIPPLIAAIIKLLCLTCRVVGKEGEDRSLRIMEENGGRAVFCTWHQRMPYHFHYSRKGEDLSSRLALPGAALNALDPDAQIEDIMATAAQSFDPRPLEADVRARFGSAFARLQ